MAKAIPRGGVATHRTLRYTNAGAVEAGDVIVANGQVLIAVNNSGANVENVYIFRGPVEFPKTAGLAIAPGEVCYWAAGAGEANKTSSANTKIGIATEAAAAGASVVLIELGENK